MKYQLWNKDLHGYSTTIYIDICLFSLLSMIHTWEGQIKHETEKGAAEKSETSCQRKTSYRKEGKRKGTLTKQKRKKKQEKLKVDGVLKGILSLEKQYAPNKLQS